MRSLRRCVAPVLRGVFLSLNIRLLSTAVPVLPLSPLTAIASTDGRYARTTAPLREVFSEFALIRARVNVEVLWLIKLMTHTPALTTLPPLTAAHRASIVGIASDFTLDGGARVKEIERTTRHDVKAVEYFIKEKLAALGLAAYGEWTHFACTSEDINNLAYALVLSDAQRRFVVPAMDKLVERVRAMAHEYAAVPMLSRTHGQSASPTTVGKELANFAYRMRRQREQARAVQLCGKLNGAVGNFNAHYVAFPHVDWTQLTDAFIRDELALTPNPYTTQIEPHDALVELFAPIMRFNTITLDLVRDCWTYVSLGYLVQGAVAGEIGSSTMPHKVNPIDFENAEGQIGLSTALLAHMSTKLPVSRMQRDLSDSTVLRSVGSAVSHALIAYESAFVGLTKVRVNERRTSADLDGAWEVVGEAVQTMMRRYGIDGAYEQLKELTRGKSIDGAALKEFISATALPAEAKAALLRLTPQTYIGAAERLARSV